jgi:cell wall-associated NlpC family hydrolase
MIEEISSADLIGIPFVKGGRPTENSKGLDCYGLVMLVHNKLGNDIEDFASPEFHAEVAEIMEREKQTWKPVWQKTETDREPPAHQIEVGDTLLI